MKYCRTAPTTSGHEGQLCSDCRLSGPGAGFTVPGMKPSSAHPAARRHRWLVSRGLESSSKAVRGLPANSRSKISRSRSRTHALDPKRTSAALESGHSCTTFVGRGVSASAGARAPPCKGMIRIQEPLCGNDGTLRPAPLAPRCPLAERLVEIARCGTSSPCGGECPGQGRARFRSMDSEWQQPSS